MFSVNYVKPNESLVFDQRMAGPGDTQLTQAIDPRVIHIQDIRTSAAAFSLAKQGFKPVQFAPEFNDFEDDEAIAAALYPRVKAFLAHEMGAEDVILFDHTYRSSTRQAKTVHNRAPVKTVHNDYTVSSAKRMVDRQTADRPDLRNTPYQFVNLWLPVTHPVDESPLAFIDQSSLSEADFKPLQLIYPDRVGEISGIAYNPHHQWFYQSRMTPGEALLFKVFDSQANSTIVGVPHSAVDVVNQTEPRALNTRSSLEFRAIVFKESP